MDDLIKALQSYGPAGLIGAIGLAWAWLKDKQVQALHEKMIAMNDRLHESIERLDNLVETLCRKDK